MKSILTLVVLFFSLGAFAGKESGGGGSTSIVNSQRVLVDFLNLDSQFKDSNSFKKWMASRIETQGKFSLTQSNEMEMRSQLDPLDLALTLIEEWEKIPYDISANIVHSGFYNPVVWNYVEKDLTVPSPFVPPRMEIKNIKFAAYYLMQDRVFNIQLSLPVWNELGIWSQTGTLIHESLRHVQIGLSNGFDEQTLQRVTAVLVMCQPQARLNYYLHYLIANRPHLAEEIYGDFDVMVQKHCKKRML